MAAAVGAMAWCEGAGRRGVQMGEGGCRRVWKGDLGCGSRCQMQLVHIPGAGGGLSSQALQLPRQQALRTGWVLPQRRSAPRPVNGWGVEGFGVWVGEA